jgi:hypothetical protein
MKTSHKSQEKTVLKVFKGKIVTLSEENGKPVVIVELDERIIPRWDMSPKVLHRIAIPCKAASLSIGDKIEVVIRK